MAAELRVGFFQAFLVLAVAGCRVHHHLEHIPKKMRRMRVFLGIAKRMVLAVHNGIRARIQERRSLENKRKQVKNTLVKLIGSKHFMGYVPVEEKCLEEQGEEPVRQKEN